MVNNATFAVAGSRKTQGIVESCAATPIEKSVLIVTFTQTNQSELKTRLSMFAGNHPNLRVLGWYAFLLKDFARPFIPFKFPNTRIKGFNFDGRPFQKATGKNRFLDKNHYAYACELSRLGSELISDSKGALIRRLECIYDDIYIDEVQDLSSHDWEIIDKLLHSSVNIHMVGDIRQSVLSTNPRSSKNKRYSYANAIEWFREREKKGLIEIIERNTTWRCHRLVAEFSDTIFDTIWRFPVTESLNKKETAHDGVFLVHSTNIYEYISIFEPACLRDTASSGKSFDLDYLNFRLSKGMSFERVLIVPTKGIADFIQNNTYLPAIAAAKLYVAVTRAEQSVAIVLDKPKGSKLPYWEP